MNKDVQQSRETLPVFTTLPVDYYEEDDCTDLLPVTLADDMGRDAFANFSISTL